MTLTLGHNKMAKSIISTADYRKKVLGCWMGKNIGGTVGAPYEWKRQINDIDFYTQKLDGEAQPNDDLDIQLLWLLAMEEKGVELDSHLLGEYWVMYVTPHWAEYGNAKINMRTGIHPPMSGFLNNSYKDSCGSFIRSEIWACIAPGSPQTAARYAYQDAIIDHGGGEGVYAEVFCAALESAAFVCNDLRKLIEIGSSYIPQESATYGAIQCVIDCYETGKSWREARDFILEKYRGQVALGEEESVSEEDAAKGFAQGELGFDVPSNIGILIIGLLYGEGDFGKTLCTAVNCGEDTDCTAATAGSIFGIMNGIDAIDQKWIDPIGNKINTITLNIGDFAYTDEDSGIATRVPSDVDELTQRTEAIAKQMIMVKKLDVVIDSQSKTDLTALDQAKLYGGAIKDELYDDMLSTIHKFDFFDVAVNYGTTPAIKCGEIREVKLTISNKYGVQANVKVKCYQPDGIIVTPAEGCCFVNYGGTGQDKKEIVFEILAEKLVAGINRLVVELTIDGRATVMLVPIALLNGNMM